MGKAGASQVHPHIQLLLGSGYYPGKMGALAAAAARHTPGRDYLQDLVDLHVGLGLGMRYKSAAVIVPLNPTKDNEFMVVGTDSLLDWTWLYWLVHRTYIEELGVFCFSQGMAMPSSVIGPGAGDTGKLMVARLGARGDCGSPYNDVSSLELYTLNSISTDYYATMRSYVKVFERYKGSYPQF